MIWLLPYEPLTGRRPVKSRIVKHQNHAIGSSVNIYSSAPQLDSQRGTVKKLGLTALYSIAPFSYCSLETRQTGCGVSLVMALFET